MTRLPARQYEGCFTFADDSVVSLQCYDGRPALRVPRRHPRRPGAARHRVSRDHGYHCECSACPAHAERGDGQHERPAIAGG
jgi:hypothetical protein